MKLSAALVVIGFFSIGSMTNAALAEDQRRIKVRDIQFIGHSQYPASRLIGLMVTRPSRFLAPSFFYPEVFADDLTTVRTFYRQNGYLDMQITDTLAVVDSVDHRMHIAITIAEGPPTLVEGITVFGNEFFPDSTLRPLIKLQPGDHLRRPDIEDGVNALLTLYGEHGFTDVTVVPQVNINNEVNRAIVDMLITEGIPARVDSILITGNEKTKRYVIVRELAFAPGDTIRYSHFLKSQRRLFLTGLFDNIFLRPENAESGRLSHKDVKIEVKENKSSEFGVIVGYGSVEKVRGRVELTTANFSGAARKVGTAVEANFIKQGISASFSEPWTFGTQWKTDVNLFGEFRQEPGYRAEALGVRTTVGRQIAEQTTLSLSYRLENTNLTRVEIKQFPPQHNPRIRSLNLLVAFDTRDDLFDPHRGWSIIWSGELAGSFLQGSDSFARTLLMVKHYFPVSRQLLIGSAIEMGWMEAFGGEEDIPLSERFYAGGPTSLRGFDYQRAGPLDSDGSPMGGKVKLVWNVVELRHTIYRSLGGAVFCDVGNVWTELGAISFRQLRVDAGFGLRFNSPIGLVRLDYSVNLDRRLHEPRSKLFLAMGQAF